jgi:hypothetical protein
MPKPQFSIRFFLIATAIIGLIGIPIGHDQYLKWLESQDESKAKGKLIQVTNGDAHAIAVVVREVYGINGNSKSPGQVSIEVE